MSSGTCWEGGVEGAADLTLPFESELERVRTTRLRLRVFAEGTSPSHGSEEGGVRGLGLVMNLTADTGPVGARRTNILFLFA